MDKSITQTGVEGSTWRDYYTLTKPKVVALMLLTTVVGMILVLTDTFLLLRL